MLPTEVTEVLNRAKMDLEAIGGDASAIKSPELQRVVSAIVGPQLPKSSTQIPPQPVSNATVLAGLQVLTHAQLSLLSHQDFAPTAAELGILVAHGQAFLQNSKVSRLSGSRNDLPTLVETQSIISSWQQS